MPEPGDHPVTIPIFEETVTIDKVETVTDAVRVHTSVETHDVLVEEIVERGVLRVARVAVDRPVAIAPPPREEGDTTILSLVEERLVVEKRLYVVEEIHVTRDRTQESVTIPVTLRTTRATIERPSDPTTGSDTNG